MSNKLEGLKKLTVPFDTSQIGKLPKPTKAQTEEVKRDYKKGARCKICGGWHHPKVVHLDYVGHAALTQRLLEVDPEWSWEPFALDKNGLPAFDGNGGMWIKLTILGVTRNGYGDSDGKKGGNGIKEAIGDGLRNAGMRFGLALDLWHKGDLHDNATKEADATPSQKKEPAKTQPQGYNSANFFDELNICQSPAEIEKLLKSPNTAKWYKNLLPEQEKIVDGKVAERTKQVTTEALT